MDTAYNMLNYIYAVLVLICRWMDADLFDKLTTKLIGKMPNTYTFTKQLAETLVKEEAASLPVAIIRPSIITAAWEEPYPVSMQPQCKGRSGF